MGKPASEQQARQPSDRQQAHKQSETQKAGGGCLQPTARKLTQIANARKSQTYAGRKRNPQGKRYSNSFDTLPFAYTFWMVWANSGPTEITLILPVWRASGTGTALVTTTSSMQEFSMRS